MIGGNSDPIFKRLMLAIDREDLGNDPTLASNDRRVPRTREIDDAIRVWLCTRSIDEALAVLNAADVPAGRIYSVADMFTDPQYNRTVDDPAFSLAGRPGYRAAERYAKVVGDARRDTLAWPAIR